MGPRSCRKFSRKSLLAAAEDGNELPGEEALEGEENESSTSSIWRHLACFLEGWIL